jgi:hypothetical protein
MTNKSYSKRISISCFVVLTLLSGCNSKVTDAQATNDVLDSKNLETLNKSKERFAKDTVVVTRVSDNVLEQLLDSKIPKVEKPEVLLTVSSNNEKTDVIVASEATKPSESLKKAAPVNYDEGTVEFHGATYRFVPAELAMFVQKGYIDRELPEVEKAIMASVMSTVHPRYLGRGKRITFLDGDNFYHSNNLKDFNVLRYGIFPPGSDITIHGNLDNYRVKDSQN